MARPRSEHPPISLARSLSRLEISGNEGRPLPSAEARDRIRPRARCVPDRTVNHGDPRSLTDNEKPRLTCSYAAQRIWV